MTDTRSDEVSAHPAQVRANADREPQFSRREFGLVTGGLLFASTSVGAAPAKTLQLSGPVERQVFQRSGYQPAAAYAHASGGPQRGGALVPIQGTWAGQVPVKLEARTILHDGCVGRALDWTTLGDLDATGEFRRELQVSAGGWYRLEVRTVTVTGEILDTAIVDPVGVGEVFVIAGQSYAGGYNDELLKLDDHVTRTVRHDWVTQTWQPAHDPFPHVGDGGTIWPAFANALLPVLQVPLGLVNVSVGATATRQWLPGEPLYQRFRDGVRNVGRFRFVLWQQGESDVIENIATATYLERLETIRSQLADDLGFAPRWLPAKSTLHPTVYRKPVEEGRIRDAIDQLWRRPGFGRGPDTDLLDGENRGGLQSRRHFSGIGQRRAGLLWFASVWTALQDDSPS